tara:strand:- start:183 stop:464 length:282 start_codon:yes stop_codon:yes gene_type:complete
MIEKFFLSVCQFDAPIYTKYICLARQWQKVKEKHQKIEEGYIYILSNKELGRAYKIGFVKEDVTKRAKALKRETGLEADFVIKKYGKQKIHSR